MTQIDRDELEELIRRVIAEERQESMAHPTRREKFTRYTDPEGKTWVSATMEKAEMAQKLLGLFLALASIISVVNYAVVNYAVMPSVHGAVESAIDTHEKAVAVRMAEIAPTLVQRAEFERRVAVADERWKNQDGLNNAMAERLKRIEEKLDRLIERR